MFTRGFCSFVLFISVMVSRNAMTQPVDSSSFKEFRTFYLDVGIGTAEVFEMSASLDVYRGVCANLSYGSTLVPIHNDFMPKYAALIEYGITWRAVARRLTPILSFKAGRCSWDNNTQDPAYAILMPPSSAKLISIQIGIEYHGANWAHASISLRNLYFFPDKGRKTERMGINFDGGVDF